MKKQKKHFVTKNLQFFYYWENSQMIWLWNMDFEMKMSFYFPYFMHHSTIFHHLITCSSFHAKDTKAAKIYIKLWFKPFFKYTLQFFSLKSHYLVRNYLGWFDNPGSKVTWSCQVANPDSQIPSLMSRATPKGCQVMYVYWMRDVNIRYLSK